MSERRRVLIVGLGISGMATAIRLHATGWAPVIVERAPQRRTGGYFVALFGAGRAAADRLGISAHLHNRASEVPGVDIDRHGRRRPGLTFADAPGSPWMLLRGDAEQAAFTELPPDVPIRYSTGPTAIEQDADGVTVTLHDTANDKTTIERYDLVVGADGLRSTVRALVFGPHEQYLHRMNYMVAAFLYPGVPAGLTRGQGATILEPGRSATVFAFTDRDPSVLLSYRTDDVDAEFTATPGQRLRAAFGPEPAGTLLADLLDRFETAEAPLFDSAEQVKMDTWHRGRVVLLGDAAWCVTLYAGMGVSAGLAGAELLGTMLRQHPGDLGVALADWERTLRPYLDDYQHSAYEQRSFFVQENRRQIRMRRAFIRLRTLPGARTLLARIPLGPDTSSKDADIVGSLPAAPQDRIPVVTEPAAG
ncbi:FAD-dependent monooxygenase [Actinoplanes sp. NPDC026670]|uniref:FAD-dependent monooxygenase n=1 Tax=Actinoplanes sp. NPDC026670 TaxID=3154700 RepID=UPI0033CA75D5